MAENTIFSNTKYFIIDMDGTFYLDGNIIEGSIDFINKVRETGRDFYFFTNNSSNNVGGDNNSVFINGEAHFFELCSADFNVV